MQQWTQMQAAAQNAAPLRMTDRVKAGIVQMIAAEGLAPGARLPTTETLCATFSVSRPVVREAIASLAAEGRVRTLRGSGVYVKEPPRIGASSMFMAFPDDIGEVLELMEFRMSIEIEAAGLAAERRTESGLLRIEQANALFARQQSGDGLSADADVAFHRAIADATQNKRFRLFVDEMGQRLIPRRALGAGFVEEEDRSAFLTTIQDEHARIIVAIAARQPDAARSAMRQHLEGGLRRYRDWAVARDAAT